MCRVPLRHRDGLPPGLVWPSAGIAARLVFQLDDCKDSGDGCGCSHSFF